MRRALVRMLFDDDKATLEAARASPVAPAVRSERALRKAARKRTDHGQPLHSFRSLLDYLATGAKHRVQPKTSGALAFYLVTIPTPLQQRALDLLGANPRESNTTAAFGPSSALSGTYVFQWTERSPMSTGIARSALHSFPLLVALTLPLTFVLATSGCSEPPPEVLTLAPAAMQPKGALVDAQKGYATFFGNGSLKAQIHIPKGPAAITIRARGNVVDGEGPVLLVYLDARIVGKLKITDVQPRDYVVKVTAHEIGTTTLALTFSNHVAPENKPLRGRWLVVESVTVKQE